MSSPVGNSPRGGPGLRGLVQEEAHPSISYHHLYSTQLNSTGNYGRRCLTSLSPYYRHQSIGVHGVRTPPVFDPVVFTYMWTPPEFLTTSSLCVIVFIAVTVAWGKNAKYHLQMCKNSSAVAEMGPGP